MAYAQKTRCPSQPLKSYNRMQMQPASSPAMPETPLAVLRLGGEKPHQGFLSGNPALYQGPTVCNSTTALGLRGQAELNRVGSRCTGKERDAESGLDNFGPRYFASTMGRFMSPDPLFISPERLFDPQLLNLYSYVRNNPLSLTDPTGLDFYLGCSQASDTCQSVQNGENKVMVQGQMVNGSFQATDVDMNEQGNPSAGYSDQFGNNYSGTFSESGGVSFTNTATGATSGGSTFIEGSDATQVAGSGAFSGITGNFFNACGGSCQARGTLTGSADAFASMKSQLVKSSAFKSFLDGLSMAHPLISQQWKDATGYAHLIKAPGDIMDMHFEGAATGAGLQSFILHTVSTIKDIANGNASRQRGMMTPGKDPDEP